jgi:hypothetical protein
MSTQASVNPLPGFGAEFRFTSIAQISLFGVIKTKSISTCVAVL